jgi:cytochrome c553
MDITAKTLQFQTVGMMKAAVLLAIVLFTCAVGAHSAHAEGDSEHGKAIAYSCFGCHAIEGYRNAYPSYRVPKLGGQKAAYLVVALKGYREGTRTHATMQAQAQSLSDQDIEDVAAYLATLNNETVEAGGSQNVSNDRATTCVACHGANGIGVSPAWPTLAGQHESYLLHALNQYRNGERKDPVMTQMAAALSDDDVAVLSAWFAGLEGLETLEEPQVD